MDIESFDEAKWEINGQTSDDDAAPLPFVEPTGSELSAQPVADSLLPEEALKDAEKHDVGPVTIKRAEREGPEAPGDSKSLDNELEMMASLLHGTPQAKLDCVWEWLDMLYPGRNGGTEHWKSLYHSLQARVDTRVQEIRIKKGNL
ncbi:hypothetical protein AURDEDRAFT_111811 [Auricularia subglabra TFB-10046 SS5]|nr:hypothetical protein AURDEDRAFT_111811 [Auricularia subglabra TFB-10046 SS5]